MAQPDKFNSFTLGIFVATLCPIAALLGTRRLREQGEFATTPRVAVSGYGDADRLWQSLEAGFDDHLVKPVTPRRLLDLLNRVSFAVATSRRLIEISGDDVRRTIERDRAAAS